MGLPSSPERGRIAVAELTAQRGTHVMRQQVSKNNTTASTITVHHHHPTVPATRVSFMTKLTVL
jgi:hypothetical protein